jgi:hypothetical protein
VGNADCRATTANIGRASLFMLRRRNEDGMTDLSADDAVISAAEKGVCGSEGFGFGAGSSRCSI